MFISETIVNSHHYVYCFYITLYFIIVCFTAPTVYNNIQLFTLTFTINSSLIKYVNKFMQPKQTAFNFEV